MTYEEKLSKLTTIVNYYYVTGSIQDDLLKEWIIDIAEIMRDEIEIKLYGKS